MSDTPIPTREDIVEVVELILAKAGMPPTIEAICEIEAYVQMVRIIALSTGSSFKYMSHLASLKVIRLMMSGMTKEDAINEIVDYIAKFPAFHDEKMRERNFASN